MSTPIACLDTGRCFFGVDGESCDLWSSPVLSPSLPKEGIAFQDSDGQGLQMLEKQALENLMSCTMARYVLFEEERDLYGRDLWAFPPPMSPSTPFGPVPSSDTLGCADLLRHGDFMYEHVYIKRIGVVGGIDVGLGLFAKCLIPAGSFVGEYTGCVRRRKAEGDDGEYGFALPVVDPDFVVCARRFGSLCRLINHSDDWNAELCSVHHEGLLHVVCKTSKDISADEQILIHYGARYWESKSGQHASLQAH
eukprot:TRINITY_DN52944_c0_g1_i1.p1 TRINITY_DN52944_c0_g1~~TRINITY_DN52944_c0_g1_i1.p1  ORF type:complete len:251 (+),score=41.03 TRINITY_DN52944_c0_g1_i1:105-857(+)